MTAAPLVDVQVTAATSVWRRAAIPLGFGLLLLAALFYQEIAAAFQTWIDSTAYNHCFLVIPIAAFLIYERRVDIEGMEIRPWRTPILLGLPIGIVWLAAERLGIMEGRQIAVIAFAQVLFMAVLGRRLYGAVCGPLLYLFFLVPFGEFLTPKLQDVTTDFVRIGLEFIGVPAYIDGYIIEIPQGTFFVAEACAGLRFLIASVAFGCLYALMIYRTPVRRGVFIAVSIVVPIVANGMRAIGIVYLGYLLNSAQAAAADHLIYGWIFFSFVILLLIVLGLPFRQDEVQARPAIPAHHEPVAPGGTRDAFFAAATLVAVAALVPGLVAALGFSAGAGVPVRETFYSGLDCRSAATSTAASGAHTDRLQCGAGVFDITWQMLPPRSTAGPVMQAQRSLTRRVMTESWSESWPRTRDGSPGAWRIIKSNDDADVMAISLWVDGHAVRPGVAMRLNMALTSITGSDHAPVVVTVSPALTPKTLNAAGLAAAQAGLEDFLLKHDGFAATVEQISAVR